MSQRVLNPRQEQFLYKYAVERLPAGVAYAEAYGRDVDDTSYTNASRLLRSAQVQKQLERLRNMYIRDSLKAYEREWQLAEDPATPPAVRQSIYASVQDRAGFLRRRV